MTKSEIFAQAQSRPFAKEDVERDSEEAHPWIAQDEANESRPAGDIVSDDGNDERLDGENHSGAAAFFNLNGDEFFNERDHNENREDADACQSGAVVYPADDKKGKNRKTDDGDHDRDAGKIEQAKLLQKKTDKGSDGDDGDEDDNSVFDLIGCQKGESDDRGSVYSESLDSDHLAEKSDESHNNRQDEDKHESIQRHAVGKGE